MEFKKCARCGNFFASELDVCESCSSKDRMDVVKFKGYIEENGNTVSAEQISLNTGIAIKNVNRYLSNGIHNDTTIGGNISLDNSILSGYSDSYISEL